MHWLANTYQFSAYSRTVIGDLAYGESFDCLRDQKSDPWMNSLFNAVKIVPYIQCLMYYRLLWILKYIVPKKMQDARRVTQQRQQAKLSRRLARGTDKQRNDFLSYILRYNDRTKCEEGSNRALTSGEIFTNASLLILAGSETTATLLSGLTYHLLRNQTAYKKLIHEIRSTFRTSKDITLQSTQALPYLSAVLEEALRIYPPAPSAFPRVVPPGPGELIDGQHVPAGTTVGVHQAAAYHSSRNFHAPCEFHPVRWMPEELQRPDSVFRDDRREVVNAFSVGPRNCIGRGLAYAEMRLVLVRVLWEFDLELVEEEEGDGEGKGLGEWQERQRVFLIWEKRPLMVRLRPVVR